MNLIKAKDIKVGTEKELYIKPILEKHYDLELTKTDEFHEMDYKSNDIYFEIKARNNNYKTYSTTMIGMNKILWLKKNNISKAYFVFIFNDGNYVFEYDPNEEIKSYIGGRNDRGKAEYKQYFYIPIQRLKKL